MKKCSKCADSKSFDDFRKRAASKDGLSLQCKTCLSERDRRDYQNPSRKARIRKSNKERRLVLQKFVRQYLESNPCVDCGQSDADLLEFDHVNGTKVAGIGDLVRDVVGKEKLIAEMQKCEVRCLYCHRKRTIKQFGWYAWNNVAMV